MAMAANTAQLGKSSIQSVHVSCGPGMVSCAIRNHCRLQAHRLAWPMDQGDAEGSIKKEMHWMLRQPDAVRAIARL